MIADFTEPRFVHRKGDRYSYLVTIGRLAECRIDSTPSYGYSSSLKSKSFRVVAQAASSILDPLFSGQSIVLQMTVPQRGHRKQVAGLICPIVVVPGPLFGASPGKFLVAVIGKGSAVVSPMSDARIANLVLAGMPPRLANAFIDEFRRVFIRRTSWPQ